jgi:hypothetical protein
MVKTYKITEIEHGIRIGKTLTRSWFRGSCSAWNNLIPGIFREKYCNDVIHEWRPEIEFCMIEDFKRTAPAQADNLPNNDNYIEWLLLMQHHGVPTRLLDWTESVLVALYFAVSDVEYKEEDGELWAMYPDALNIMSGIPGVALLDSRQVRYLAAEPMCSNHEKLSAKYKLEQIPKFPIAFRPPLRFPRMYSQFSTFTIHPSPQEQCTIPALLDDETKLIRYIIPSKCKEQIQRDLESLKITRNVLFPNLDSLGASLATGKIIIAYAPPKPPYCGGEYLNSF